jgi:hypothetical protein
VTVDFMVRFDDFSGGDFGVRDSALANSNMFSGENVVLYPSGLVGPRAGLKLLPVTGLPDHPVVPGPMGFTVYNNSLLIVLNRVYQVPMAGGAATAWAAYPSPAITPVRFAAGNGVMYSLLNGVLYKHTGTSATTAITTPAPLSEIVRWGYFFVGVDRNRPWRIWFNQVDAAGSDFDTWPVDNYYDVGNNDPITCLKPIYNTLYAGKKEGWWAVSGVLGQLAAIRDVAIGNGPIDCRQTAITTDNRIIYWPVQNVPAWFNGERVLLETEQIMSPRNLPYTGDGVIVTPTARRILMAGDDGQGGTRLYAWQNGAWQHHRANSKLGALAPSDVREGSNLPTHVVYAAERPTTIGDPTRIATIAHELNRPAHANDTYASPVDQPVGTDLVSGSLITPAWLDGQGRQVRVRWMQVQFRKWASGVAESVNRFTVRVESLGPYGAGSKISDPVFWIEPSERAPTGGANDSWRVNLGEQGWGNGFRLHFDVIAGVAIREVIVGVNLRTERQ